MKKPSEHQLELHKWCIEMAVNWKWSPPSIYNVGLASVGGGYKEQQAAEPNVIARAEQIYNWINKGN